MIKNRVTHFTFVAATLTIVLCSLAVNVHANRRHFSYTYESPVLSSGGREIEIWNTLRTDKGEFFRGIDHRMELEWGLGSSLQSSIYLNMSQESAGDGAGGYTNSFEYSFANEWKLNLTDPTADIVGSALYAEWTVEGDATELEGKVILDKHVGNLLIAANVKYEHEFLAVGTLSNNTAEATLAVGYIVDAFTLGVEARHTTLMLGDDNFTGFFAGPSITYGGKGWWAAGSVMPQIVGSNSLNIPNQALDLSEHEKVEVRFLVGFEL